MNNQDTKKPKKESMLLDTATKKLVTTINKRVNDKDLGARIPAWSIVNYAISKLSDEDIQILQKRSYTNADKKKLYHQRYIAQIGPISVDEFEGFCMSPEFQKFKKEHRDIGA